MSWTATGGGDHGGEDWVISSATTVGGAHTGVGVFRVTGSIWATVQAGSTFEVACIEAEIATASYGIDARAAGGTGGTAGSGGSAGDPGSNGAAGGAGTGSGAGGAGAGAGHGGAGGVQGGGAGAHGTGLANGGNGGQVGSAGSAFGSATDLTVNQGSGGGGPGGGGGGGNNGLDATDGQSPITVGGRGGGAVHIKAARKIVVTGKILADAGNGDTGGSGGTGAHPAETGQGCGGGGGGCGSGGGSGGTVLLEAPLVTLASGSVLSAIGGNGGDYGAAGLGGAGSPAGTNGGVGAAGGGGGGGRVKVSHSVPAANWLVTGGTISAVKGTGGADGNDGTAKYVSDGVPEAAYNPLIFYREGKTYPRLMGTAGPS